MMDQDDAMTKSANERLALVTGATRGIGLAIAQELARQGLRVIVAGRDAPLGVKVAGELGGRACFQMLDVTDDGSIAAIAASLQGAGGLDVLVNNAGASFDGFDASVARRTLDVNFAGMMRLTDRLLPLLHRDARIVMVSSGMGDVSILGAALRAEVMKPQLDRAQLAALAIASSPTSLPERTPRAAGRRMRIAFRRSP